MIRKVVLGVVGAAVLLGLVRNLATDPGSGLAGLLVLVVVGYVFWRAAGLLRADLGRARRSLGFTRSRHGGSRGPDTL